MQLPIEMDKADIPRMVKQAVKDQVMKIGVGVVLWNLTVSVISSSSLYGLMLGLKATFHRINNLHMHTEEPPCIIKYILWKERLTTRILRKICCCPTCKTLELPTLDGRSATFSLDFPPLVI